MAGPVLGASAPLHSLTEASPPQRSACLIPLPGAAPSAIRNRMRGAGRLPLGVHSLSVRRVQTRNRLLERIETIEDEAALLQSSLAVMQGHQGELQARLHEQRQRVEAKAAELQACAAEWSGLLPTNRRSAIDRADRAQRECRAELTALQGHATYLWNELLDLQRLQAATAAELRGRHAERLTLCTRLDALQSAVSSARKVVCHA